MRENKVRTIWQDGGAVVNGWLGIPSSFSAEVMAATPYDAITIDTQHGMVDFTDAVSMLGAISGYGPTPFARVPWNDPAAIMKLLDAGAYGIVCPMINTAEECERFVGACRYAPAGYRSFGPARASLYGGPDYAAKANETIVTMAMIETEQAVSNLDEIMAVDGLDAIYVGPNDLAISLGNPPNPEPTAANVIEAVDTILAAAKRNDVAAGIHCPHGASARDKIEKGFQFVTIANDFRLMALASANEIEVARGGNA
jgi:4-hydroxy-2-oxoheptanedioate aldolase